jgi:hypothetical protein
MLVERFSAKTLLDTLKRGRCKDPHTLAHQAGQSQIQPTIQLDSTSIVVIVDAIVGILMGIADIVVPVVMYP